MELTSAFLSSSLFYFRKWILLDPRLKMFLYFRKRNFLVPRLETFLYFLKKCFSSISRNGTYEKNSGNGTFYTAQSMKLSMKGFFSKCDQIRNFLRIWSLLLKKSLMENFIFCLVLALRLKTFLYFLKKAFLYLRKIKASIPKCKNFLIFSQKKKKNFLILQETETLISGSNFPSSKNEKKKHS